ncbi:MAG: N-acetyltransferase [Pseudomonadota bacterium]
MPDHQIRVTTSEDLPELSALYRDAFPEEDLWPLVSALLSEETIILSNVALSNGTISGHIVFTFCDTIESGSQGALLGPLAVDPAQQGDGVGTALVQDGVARLGRLATRQIFVLGDPGYYARFSFASEHHVRPPCPIPEAWAPAWQSQTLPGRKPLPPGILHLPEPWRDPSLWAP